MWMSFFSWNSCVGASYFLCRGREKGGREGGGKDRGEKKERVKGRKRESGERGDEKREREETESTNMKERERAKYNTADKVGIQSKGEGQLEYMQMQYPTSIDKEQKYIECISKISYFS